MGQRRRNERQAQQTQQAEAIQDHLQIPLKSPPNQKPTQPRGKTLYEIAAERQVLDRSAVNAEDIQGAKLVTIKPDGSLEDYDRPGALKGDGVEPVSPLADSLLLACSLSALHFTLDVLTVHQYAQELRFPPIITRTLLVALPTLFFAIHLAHGHLIPISQSKITDTMQQAARSARQILFLIAANIAGCYLIQLTNDKGYYAVMKKAPSIGTIWVWCVLEMGLAGALAGVVGPGLYAWHYGYGIL